MRTGCSFGVASAVFEIHMERGVRSMKLWKILINFLAYNSSCTIDSTLFVVMMLCNWNMVPITDHELDGEHATKQKVKKNIRKSSVASTDNQIVRDDGLCLNLKNVIRKRRAKSNRNNTGAPKK